MMTYAADPPDPFDEDGNPNPDYEAQHRKWLERAMLDADRRSRAATYQTGARGALQRRLRDHGRDTD